MIVALCFLRNLCGLTYSLYATLDRDSAFADSRQGLIDKFCFVFPLALVVLAYVFDSDEHMASSVENGVLNVARHSCKCSFRIHLSTLYFMGLFYVIQVKCSMRFSSMTVEWLLLHIHLLWSGGGIVALSTLSWLKIGSIQKSMGLDARTNIGAESRRKISGQKKRLFRIAFMTSMCLLMSLAITIATAGVLEDWSRSSEIWLQCRLYKAHLSPVDSYNFEDGEEVCSDAIWTMAGDACTSACYYSEKTTLLVCETQTKPDICDCSCDDLVKLEKPSMPAMTIRYLAQSMVVVIVGINMGLRSYRYTFMLQMRVLRSDPRALLVEIAYNQGRLHEALANFLEETPHKHW